MPQTVRVPSEIAIVLPPDAPAPERFAAEELAAHLLEAGGVVAAANTAPSGFCVYLGGACPEGFLEGLPDEGFRYAVDERGITIGGMGPRGTVYGVYAFLEDLVGYRWYTSTVRRVPAWDRTLPMADVRRSPAFAYREPYWRDATDGAFALRLGLNGSRTRISDEHGGRVRFHRFSHTFEELVPPDVYFDEHPEYFSLVNGERLRVRSQLCLTNPDVLRIATEGVRCWIRENPDCNIFSVAQNDWYHNCTCPACAALDEHEGSSAGSMLHFVNAIVDAIAEEAPDVLLHTFAYIYTRKAPRYVRPRKNIIVRLCSIECCFSHPIATCTHAVKAIDVQDGTTSGPFSAHDTSLFLRDLRDWSAICDNLHIWDYTVDFANYPQPYPNIQVLQPNLQLFRDHGVRGVLEQGNFSPGSASAFAGLKVYLLGKLLWDPDMDTGALISDFLDGVFGPAAPYLAQYLEMMEAAARTCHMGLYDMPNAPYFTDELLDRADALFGEALAACAGEGDTLARVELEYLSVRYVRLARLPLDTPGRDALLDELHRDLKRLDVTEVFERKELAASIECLKRSRYGLDRTGVPYIDYRM